MMHSKSIGLLLRIMVAIVVTACNNDIFVDYVPGDDVYIELDGDGGEETIAFSRKDLKGFGPYDLLTSKNVTCYDKSGNVIAGDSPVSQIARINVTSASSMLDVFVGNDKLTFKSTEHSSPHGLEWHFNFELDYGYAFENVFVTVLPGRSMELKSVDYDFPIEVDKNFLVRTTTYHIDNRGQSSYRMEISPYHNKPAYRRGRPRDAWADGLTVKMQVPQCVDGQWGMSDPLQINIDETSYYPRPDSDSRVQVDVPADSKVDVNVAVYYVTAEISGDMTFVMPVSGRENVTRFSCSVSEPVNYKITVSDGK